MTRHALSMTGQTADKLGLGLDFNQLQPAATKPAFDGFGAAGLGDSASPVALERLRALAAQAQLEAVTWHLKDAVAGLTAENFEAANAAALRALDLDEKCGVAWHVLAIAREKLGDLSNSLRCYQAAHDLLEDPELVAGDLGRLAYRLNMKEAAETLFRRVLSQNPLAIEAANNLACTLKDLEKYPEAIEVLKTAIAYTPNDPSLWNTLGTIVSEQGDSSTAMIFYNEALSHDPSFAKAVYNIAKVKLLYGDLVDALADCNTALKMKTTPDEAAMMHLARSSIHLCLGDLKAGWDDYEARLDPVFSVGTQFVVNRPRWVPQTDLSGKSLLVIGEQGLGDEILFGTVLPDVLAALGPNGQLVLAVEPRLLPLMSRSFPSAKLGAHATYDINQQSVRLVPFVTKPDEIDYWTPMASLLRQYRQSLEAFGKTDRVLTADPARIAHWQAVLRQAPPGPKIGLLWKSLKMVGARNQAFSPFALWAPILQTPGISLINFQYGDCDEELAWARSELGIEIWQPPGIDLKNDLDDVAALSCALDLTIGFANATTNIAAACGNRVWLISPPDAWPRLGTKQMPWYPTAEVFVCEKPGDWVPTMAAVAAKLAKMVQSAANA